MEGYWLSKRCTQTQATTILRWMAMSIVKASAGDRQLHYAAIQMRIEAAIKRAGLSGDEAHQCLVRNMNEIRAFVAELQNKRLDDAKAA
jgi:hypothetical protein